MTHKEICQKAIDWLQSLGARGWQTYPGKAYKGELAYRDKNGSIKLKNATIIEPCPIGEPDLHFFEPVTITADMVGRKVLLFGKAEIKTLSHKRLTIEQQDNLSFLKKIGGKALVIREQKDGSIDIKEFEE